MGEKKSYTDIVIGRKIRGTIMSEIGRHDVSTKLVVDNNIIWGSMSEKYQYTPNILWWCKYKICRIHTICYALDVKKDTKVVHGRKKKEW